MNVLEEYLILEKVAKENKRLCQIRKELCLARKASLSSLDNAFKAISHLSFHFESLSFEERMLFSSYKPFSSELLLNVLVLFHLRYEKNVDKNKLKEGYLETIRLKNLLLKGDDAFSLMEEASQTPFVLPEVVKSIPSLYEALSLEIPQDIYTDLVASFGKEKTRKLVASLEKKPLLAYGLVDETTAKKEYDRDKDFIAYDVLGDREVLYTYLGDEKKIGEEIKQKRLFSLSFLQASALSNLSFPLLSSSFLYLNGCPSLLSLYSAFQSEKVSGMTLALFDDEKSVQKAKEEKKRYQLSSYNLLVSSNALLKTYASPESFDLVTVSGLDSKNSIPQSCFALPFLRKEQLLLNQKKILSAMEEGVYFVKKGGYLLYLAHSYLRLETDEVLKTFCFKHPEFETILVHKVFYEIEKTVGGYYAILRRKS